VDFQSSDPIAAVGVRPNGENRLVGKALKFWESVRADGELPRTSVLDMEDCPFGAEDSLVMEIGVGELDDKVVDLKKPMADVGRFFNKKGQEVLYRSILLPLSDDGIRVNRVVSAFSYKVVH